MAARGERGKVSGERREGVGGEHRERVGRGGERESRGDRATVQGKINPCTCTHTLYMYTRM